MKFNHPGNYISFRYHPNKTETEGFFDRDDKRIYIRSSLSKCRKELIYIHEGQHKKCFESNCFCWEQESDFWGEYHAFRAELKFAIVSEYEIIRRIYLSNIEPELERYKRLGETIISQRQHYLALSRLCKTAKFQQLAKEYGYWQQVRRYL